MKRLLDETEALSPRLFMPAAMVVLIAGVLMVVDGPWSFGELWIVLGLIGFAATVFTGVAIVTPRAERIEAMLERDGGLAAVLVAGTALVVARAQAISEPEPVAAP